MESHVAENRTVGNENQLWFLINTEHKALRCSLRLFARPPSGSSRPAAKHSLSSKVSPADGEHGGSVFPDKILPVARKYAMN